MAFANGGNLTRKSKKEKEKIPDIKFTTKEDEKSAKKVVKEVGKFFMLGAIFVIIAAFVVGGISGMWLQNRLNPPKIIEKEVSVEVEKIQYVEKSKTATADFLTFLNPNLDPSIAGIMAEAIDKYSQEYKLPRKLIVAISRKESFFNPFAKSHAGAMGLMQVMPNIHKAKWEGRKKSELYHIDLNIKIGCQIFREYLDMEKGNLDKTFHRYLSKKASKQQAKKYQTDIEAFWAQLELYDYMTSREREEKKNEENVEVSDSVIKPNGIIVEPATGESSEGGKD